jgi:putative ABC transport system permease protein
LGIALGVAVVLAVDLANTSARRSFELSMNRINGHATHQISGDIQGIPEAVYAQLRLAHGVRAIAPVVIGYLPVADKPGQLFQILGIDPFAEYLFRLNTPSISDTRLNLRALLLNADAALLPDSVGAKISLQRGESTFVLKRVGNLIGPEMEGLIITDISTAQALLGQTGTLSRIDLILPDDAKGQQLAAKLQAWLPPSLKLEQPQQTNRATQDLSSAFSLNLTAMSLLALVVGMFMIYNAISFSVVQRRALVGTLRALGVTYKEVLIGVIGEALLLGLAGTTLGLFLGLWLGSSLIHLVTRTINDLYYVISVREFFIDPASLAKGIALGLLATLVAAWLPAREAAATPPNAVLSRAHLESRWRTHLPQLGWIGLILLATGSAVLSIFNSLILGFVGLFLLVLGCAALTPLALVGLVRLNQPLCNHFGLVVRMANRDVARHLSRTGIAIAALMVAFATTVGVGIMVESFRSGVAIWIKDLLNADIYLAPPDTGGNSIEGLKPTVVAALQNMPDVAAISLYRRTVVKLNHHPIPLLAVDLAPTSQAGYRLLDTDPLAAWTAFKTGKSILISEPLAYRQHLKTGDTLEIPTATGSHHFKIAGVFLDYGSEQGRILVNRSDYERYWRDTMVTSAAVFVAPDVNISDLRNHLRETLGMMQPLLIRPNRELQAKTLEIFDRTFTITQVLRLLAILVAVVGVLSALLALQMERAREFAIVRAMGMTTREVGVLVSLQTGFMGAAAGLLALPTGIMLAAVLIFVINRRAFGWSLPFEINPSLLLETVGLAIFTALLAGLYPIWRMARTQPAAALRAE